MKNNLSSFFYPKTIGVVGASRHELKVGRIVFNNLLKAKGIKVIPVNKEAKEIRGIKCFPNLLSIPENVDLGIICVPASFVFNYLIEAVKKKINNIVILSAGFSEIGQKGCSLENKIKEFTKIHHLNVLGPNTLGYINTSLNLNATFSDFWPRKGGISFISQSGAFTTTFLDWADLKGVGIAKIICLGNKLDINEVDAIEFLAQDQNTQAIALYLESFHDGKAFIKTASKLIGLKPLIVFKSGKSNIGKERAISHTGKMAGSYEAAQAAFEKVRAFEAFHIDTFLNLAYLFSKKIKINDNKIYIITNAGGPGVIATDEVINSGWKLAKPSPKSSKQFKKYFPSCASFKNPIDIIGDAPPQRFKTALELIDKESVDNILILVSPQAMTDVDNTAKAIAQFSNHSKKNILTCFLGGTKIREAETLVRESRTLNFHYPNLAITTINNAYKFFKQWHLTHTSNMIKIDNNKKNILREILINAKEKNKLFLDQTEVSKFCQYYELPMPKHAVITNLNDALKKAFEFGFPVVLKTQNLHKTDRKEVYLNLRTRNDLQKAYSNLIKISNTLLIQKQILHSTELILGSFTDPEFGPIISFGIGGIYTEIIKKFRTIIPPVSSVEIADICENVSFYPLIQDGFRGQKRPFKKLCQLVSNFSLLVTDFPEIESIEINPLMMTNFHLYCVDVRILIR